MQRPRLLLHNPRNAGVVGRPNSPAVPGKLAIPTVRLPCTQRTLYCRDPKCEQPSFVGIPSNLKRLGLDDTTDPASRNFCAGKDQGKNGQKNCEKYHLSMV